MQNGTIALGFRADQVGARQGLFSEDGGGTGEGGYLSAWIDDGKFYMRQQDDDVGSPYIKLDVDLSARTEYALAVSFGDASLKAYLNGVLVAAGAAADFAALIPIFTQRHHGSETSHHLHMRYRFEVTAIDPADLQQHDGTGSNDTLDGGAGADIFHFQTQINARARYIDPLKEAVKPTEVSSSVAKNLYFDFSALSKAAHPDLDVAVERMALQEQTQRWRFYWGHMWWLVDMVGWPSRRLSLRPTCWIATSVIRF